MLTGLHVAQLPEARPWYKGSHTLDSWPLLFKDVDEMNYATLFSDDDPAIGAFHYRLSGFNKKPTDKYLLPFFRATLDEWNREGLDCAHKHAFEYLKHFSKTYQLNKKFSLITGSALTHGDLNAPQIADEDTLNLLTFFAQEKFKNNTAIFFFGDHGSRSSNLRRTITGKLEERLPFMSLTLPSWFIKKYPKEFTNLKTNSEILTSHFDIYQTLLHLIWQSNYTKTRKVGASLFTNISALNRTCDDAGIPLHFCPCLQYKMISKNQSRIIQVAEAVVEYMNNLTATISEGKQLCSKLVLKDILRAREMEPNKKLQQYVGTYSTKECDRCGVEENVKFKLESITYEVLFSVEPSGGLYEATVEYVNKSKQNERRLRVNADISRTNLYGDQPKCIAHQFPHLRKYCFCK